MELELPHLGLGLFGIDRDALLWILEYLELSDIGRLDSVSPFFVRPPIHLELPLSLPHEPAGHDEPRQSRVVTCIADIPEILCYKYFRKRNQKDAIRFIARYKGTEDRIQKYQRYSIGYSGRRMCRLNLS
jgi:hypothetical protein